MTPAIGMTFDIITSGFRRPFLILLTPVDGFGGMDDGVNLRFLDGDSRPSFDGLVTTDDDVDVHVLDGEDVRDPVPDKFRVDPEELDGVLFIFVSLTTRTLLTKQQS